MAKNFTTRKEDYAKWYNELVIKADLADNSPVRGCMIIKPYGYAIWESMQQTLDKMFKKTGHRNVYFPIFIPKSFFAKEASHVEGFAKECAVVTHYRLKNDEEGNEIVVDDNAKLEEELVVRPTSETIIWDTYRTWIQSYRDLPLLLNQWANVVRWEMRTRLFLRTSEFLWQEGHTAHATQEEAEEEAAKMLDVYADFAERYMAMPVWKGRKSESERFAGAEDTYCIEAMMQDGKALQAGTSHFLGQNFAKAFDVKFLDKNNQQQYVWAASWGVSTRLMGALIMAHSDDQGLVLPPKLAPDQVVIVPIYRTEDDFEKVNQKALEIKEELDEKDIRVQYDNRDTQKPGWKFSEYEFKGVPVRIAIGPKDIENGTVEVARRDTMEKSFYQATDISNKISNLLENIQQNLYNKALAFREEHTATADNWDEFKEIIENRGGFVLAHWDGTAETEEKIKKETKASIRLIPFKGYDKPGKCVYTGNYSKGKVVFAKAY